MARILILGAGSVGLPFAARLSCVAEVVAVSRERHATAITSQGLTLHGAWGSGTYRFRCTTEVPDEKFDFILVTAKSNDTRELYAVQKPDPGSERGEFPERDRE